MKSTADMDLGLENATYAEYLGLITKKEEDEIVYRISNEYNNKNQENGNEEDNN